MHSPSLPSAHLSLAALPFAALALLATGCASPGPPRAPSLQLPGPVRNLAAERHADTVTLRFTMPTRTTDDEPIRDKALTPILCRAELKTPCTPLPAQPPQPVADIHGKPTSVILTDIFPAAFSTGPLRPAEYRVELLNSRGKTAGFSSPVFIAAGAAPTPVEGFRVSATRLGSLLSWTTADPDSGRVIVRRTDLTPSAPGTAHPEPTLLRADTTGAAANISDRMLDTSATEGTPYTYVVFRERTVTLEGHALTLRSAESAPVAFTLHDTFPPPVPTGLSAAPFTTEATAKTPATFAIDLIWQPVDDPGLAGYNIYRTDAANTRTRLNSKPLPTTAFHDPTALPTATYTYSITAIDNKGNESTPASITVSR